MRRLSVLIGTFILAAACGHKNVQVKAPLPGSVSSNELEGIASYYAEPYHGRKTASGEIFDTYQGLTAAHRTLPFHTLVRVTNEMNGREVDVTINDRGPFIDGRVIDLSLRAAREIDMVRAGVAPVKLRVLESPAVFQKTALSQSSPVYAVQVGAFEILETAQDLKKQLEDKKYPDVRIEIFLAEKTLYRVRIGRESNLQGAQKLAAILDRDGFQSFVLRVN